MNSKSKQIEELSNGWVLCSSKSNPGRQYYFNRKTGKSSWTDPQSGNVPGNKTKKKKKEKAKQEETKNEVQDKSVKRKSDGTSDDSGSSKRQRNEPPQKSKEDLPNKNSPKTTETKPQEKRKTFSPTKRKSCNETTPKSTSTSSSPLKITPTKNIASKRLSQLRARLSVEANNEFNNKTSPQNTRESPKPGPNDTPLSRPKTELRNPNLGDSFTSPTNKLPSSDSTQSKITPKKNIASNRLSHLRAQLSAEAINELDNKTSPQNTGVSLKPGPNDKPLSTPKTELRNPYLGDSFSSLTNKLSSSDSLQSTKSPSQFLAANKIICSMKAQLPEEFSNRKKPKNTFEDIEHGICHQVTEYPVIKNPSTPPQFSEASKLVSAIKSKLAYTRKDKKTFKSAKERMESLRTSIGEEDLEQASSIGISPQNIISPQNCIGTQNNISPQNPQNLISVQNRISPQKCEAMEVEDINESPNPAGPRSTINSNDGQLVLVVDTNIFIHELNFIKNVLNSHIKGYSEQPMLLVPWRVINELDRLKDNNNGKGEICKHARAAMDYLYKSLPENSRIKGQSLRDSNSHIYPCELPDDEILNCALQQAERGRNVLLLSNDKNLCNKASINGIKRMSIEELKVLVEHKPQQTVDPDLLVNFKHYQQTMYQLLANILENEMRAKYNNIWQHVVFKAPPWELGDVLQCLLKHWFAVFSEVFPRIEYLITDLKNTYTSIESKNPSTITESEVANFKELCIEIARKCQIIPEYMELAKLTVERLSRASETEDARGREMVVGAFETLWKVFSSYCAKLSTLLGITHSIEDHIPGTESLDNLTSKFVDFSGSIFNIIMAIDGVLNIQDTSSMDEKTVRLHNAFGDALLLTLQEKNITREHLREFCITNRNMLQEALTKFTQLAQLLDACKNALACIAN